MCVCVCVCTCTHISPYRYNVVYSSYIYIIWGKGFWLPFFHLIGSGVRSVEDEKFSMSWKKELEQCLLGIWVPHFPFELFLGLITETMRFTPTTAVAKIIFTPEIMDFTINSQETMSSQCNPCCPSVVHPMFPSPSYWHKSTLATFLRL